jgi:hypothetical protein
MIWNGRQGVTGAAVEDDAPSHHGFTFPLLVPFLAEANKKSDGF